MQLNMFSKLKRLKLVVLYSSVLYSIALMLSFFIGKYIVERLRNSSFSSFVVWVLLSLSVYVATHVAVHKKKYGFSIWKIAMVCLLASLAIVGINECARKSGLMLAVIVANYLTYSIIAIGGAVALNTGSKIKKPIVKSLIYGAIIPPLPVYLVDRYGMAAFYVGLKEWILYCLTSGIIIGVILGISITAGYLINERSKREEDIVSMGAAGC